MVNPEILTQSTDLYELMSSYFGISTTAVIIIMLVIAIWTIIWKGLALWKSAKKSHIIWFIILLLVNTVGILEILYIYVFSKFGKIKKKETKELKKKKKK